MFMRVCHITLYTDDQDKAKAFYCDKVGFQVNSDVMMNGMRWLTLSLPKQPGLELILFKATKPESQALIGKQSPEGSFMILATDDCEGDYKALRERGVTFIKEPTKESYGTQALFKDLHGNTIDMIQG